MRSAREIFNFMCINWWCRLFFQFQQKHFRLQARTELWARGLPFHVHNAPCNSSFCDLALESFLVLSQSWWLSLKHFNDGLRKQGRKTVKRAFHFLDRGKNAWLNQIFKYKVSTVILSFSVNIFSFEYSKSVLIFSDYRRWKMFLRFTDGDC